MLEALLWGLAGSSSLVIGAVLGLRVSLSERVLGLLLGFGAGALISAVSTELAQEALDAGGAVALGVGLTVGALAFYLGNRAIEGLGGSGRPARPRGADAQAPARALALGALLDGVPEQAAIGLSLAAGGEEVGFALVAATFISNVPEALASAAAMRRAQRTGQVLRLWAGIAVLCALASVAGYVALGSASGAVVGVVQATAAGAILVMLVDAMVPQAVREGGNAVGLVTVLGFAAAALISAA